MKIQVEKPTENYLQSKEVLSWPIWEKEVSRFDWHYGMSISINMGPPLKGRGQPEGARRATKGCPLPGPARNDQARWMMAQRIRNSEQTASLHKPAGDGGAGPDGSPSMPIAEPV
jgi:hypothetical protein